MLKLLGVLDVLGTNGWREVWYRRCRLCDYLGGYRPVTVYEDYEESVHQVIKNIKYWVPKVHYSINEQHNL